MSEAQTAINIGKMHIHKMCINAALKTLSTIKTTQINNVSRAKAKGFRFIHLFKNTIELVGLNSRHQGYQFS